MALITETIYRCLQVHMTLTQTVLHLEKKVRITSFASLIRIDLISECINLKKSCNNFRSSMMKALDRSVETLGLES